MSQSNPRLSSGFQTSETDPATGMVNNRFRVVREPVVEVVPRKEFVYDVFDYGNGQHVTALGPTQRGKTTLCLQLLRANISPERRAVILAGKPPGRDKTMAEAAQKLNLRIVEEWPPGYRPKDRNRNGYVLRPHHSMRDLKSDNANLQGQFRAALLGNYGNTKQPTITMVDEAHHVQQDLKLKPECEALLMRGAPHAGCWSLVQRGRYVSYQCYDAPEHIFIFYDPDMSNRMRYAEIGGVDPKYVEELASTLKTQRVPSGGTVSQALYIRRSGPELYIVDI